MKISNFKLKIRKAIKKITKSIAVAFLLFLVCLINGPTPVFADSVTDYYTDTYKINPGSSSGYVVTGSQLKMGNPSNIVAWWKMDEASGITASDSAGSNTGTTYGAGGAATGGTITSSGGYTTHAFTTIGSSTLTMNTPMNVQVLAIAGGGGGGHQATTCVDGGGGGGAGGLVYNAAYAASGSISVTVGGGGAIDVNGNNSIFGTITATGGGAGRFGMCNNGGNGNDGGSGGGACDHNGGSGTGGAGSQGYKGGNVSANPGYYSVAGGGGAGGAAANAGSNLHTNGGIGVDYSSIYGTAYGVYGWFAGGGGAACCAAGGQGGGGGAGGAGTANTGGGGGGNAAGGSGIVLVRYPTPSTVVTGKFVNGRSFDGVSDYVNLTSTPTTSTGSFTIEGWIKTSTTGTTQRIVTYGTATTNNGISLFVNTSNQVEADVYGGTGPTSTTTITDGTWHHVAVVNTAGSFQIYIDGSTSGSPVSLSPNITSSSTNRIGTNYAAGADWFKGSIDDVRIYNSARNQTQIQADVNNYTYQTPSTIVSNNLLTGTTGVDGIDEFVYNLSSLPANTTATVQFTQDPPDVAATGGTVTTISGPANQATGGIIIYTDSSGLNPRSTPYVGGYTVHTFTSSGTFTPKTSGNVDYLVVGGGGGGGGIAASSGSSAGGGAGGYRTGTGLSVTAQSYSVTVGTGGAGGAAGGNNNGTKGNDSVFNGITATGGGYGGKTRDSVGGDGGSGGGGGYSDSSTKAGGNGNTPYTSPSQGSNGGSGGVNYPYCAGGGGGAGAVGSDANTPNGGTGISSSISGSSVYYSGGGGGGCQGVAAGTGGTGGGGNGGQNGAGTTGTTNTGGGGGGAGGSASAAGGTGGLGVVIIRYPTSSQSQYTVHTFTTVGSDTFTANTDMNVDYLVVAGGGGGGNDAYNGGGGGGGGGGVKIGTLALTTGAKTVTVGDGGNPYNGSTGPFNGADSVFNTITAHGGGHALSGSGAGVAGGSGGGGNAPNGTTSYPGGAGIAGEGYDGGASYSNWGPWNSGGGGGAGARGQDAPHDNNGALGGAGLDMSPMFGTTWGVSGWFAGGGGAEGPTPAGKAGGQGGGGAGGSPGTPGTANTGGGGGGGFSGAGHWGGKGGSGIVIVRYPTPSTTNWYSSLGVLNGTDTLTAGTNTINLHNLTWSGSSFFYKITFTSDGSATPTLDDVTVNYTSGGYTNGTNTVNDTFATVGAPSGLTSGVNKIQLSYSGMEGSGIDGAITVGANLSINSNNLISGRTCTDVGGTGGDAPYYSVSALTSTSATLTASPSSACLRTGDEVLLINLQGQSSSITNTGNYETLRIQSISSNVITFTTSKANYYGDGVSNDSNLGIGVGNQKVMLQRVPNYTNVTINTGYSLSPDAYNYATGVGGVLFFRANGTVSVNGTGTINANAKGFTGGVGSASSAVATTPGHGAFYTTTTAGNGGLYQTAGIAGVYSGGGGTGGAWATTGGSGTGNIGAGGGGGGGTPAGSTTCAGGGGGGGGGGYATGGGYGYANTGQSSANGVAGDTSNSGSGGRGGGGCSGDNSGGGAGGGAGNYGVANLTKLYFGSGGGGGGGGSASNIWYTGSNGGTGGGIINIVANTITVTGGITSTGGTSGTTNSRASCGGGGAGGSVRLVGGTVTLGTTKVTSGGGSGAGGTCTYTGGTGGNGRIAVGGGTVTGTTSPTLTSISALSTGTYSTTGSYTSPNLLTGISSITSINSFSYNLTALPANTGVTVQFSQDGANWYNHSGAAGGTDTLASGSNTICLNNTSGCTPSGSLNWSSPYLYYKLAFTSDGSGTPVLTGVSANYTTSTTSPASSTWPGCTPLPGKNWNISNDCFLPKTGNTYPNTNIDGIDNGNLTVAQYKTLTVRGDQIIVRNNDPSHNVGKIIVNGTIVINDIPIGGVGGNVRDYSANDNEGSAVGSTVVSGKYNKARSFNGTSDYIGVGVLNNGTSVKTVEFWINPSSNAGEFIDLNNGTNYVNATGGTISAPGFTTIYVNGSVSSTISAGSWQHVAVTTATGISASAVNIGKRGSNYYNGTMDDVRIYDYARSSDQIAQDMNYVPNPTGNGPIAWWRFEDGGQIKETNLWSLDADGDGWTQTLENQDKAQTASPGTGWVRRKDTVGSIFGTGKDGPQTFTSNTNLSTWNHSGRTCADGGDVVSYNITAFGTATADNGDNTVATVTLSSTPSSGCLGAGDNVLIINAQGATSAYGNAGNYELLKIFKINGTTITFTTAKKKYYGSGGSDDNNLGTTYDKQKIVLQRIPQYSDATVNSGVTVYVSDWNGAIGGILAFQVNGTLINNGTMGGALTGSNRDATGFRGGVGGTGFHGGNGGETYNGFAGKGIDNSPQPGGGGGGIHTTAADPSQPGTIGGGGGGGGGRFGGGGGAGFVGIGYAASCGSRTGQNGSGNTGGNGGPQDTPGNTDGCGGGGGTYGIADLSQIYFGSGGGGGGPSGAQDGGCNSTASGGDGGGIVFIMANTATMNTGSIITANGGEGGTDGCGTSSDGSGSGGSIKIFAKTATLGTNIVRATGGTTSTAAGNGRIAIWGGTITGTTNPTYQSLTAP
jgi:hypothetical protein